MEAEVLLILDEMNRKLGMLDAKLEIINKLISPKQFVTVADFAKLVGVPTSTVYTWINEKKIIAAGAKGESKRIPYSEVQKHLP